MLKTVFGLLLVSAPLSAQTGTIMVAPQEPVPAITVSARGDVKVAPDRATIEISVQTRATTAAAAGTENARKHQAVLNALKALGLTNDQLATIGYNVNPEYSYEERKTPRVTGYQVTNTIRADVRDLTQVGPVIDKALSNGANVINSLTFYASNTEAARREAISLAVGKARADAESAARAAGGTLGGLIELNVGSYYAPPPRPMYARAEGMVAASAPDTPINAGEQTLTVDVNTRWRFVK